MLALVCIFSYWGSCGIGEGGMEPKSTSMSVSSGLFLLVGGKTPEVYRIGVRGH